MRRLFCRHPEIRLHTTKVYLPDNTHIIGTCLACGRNKHFNLGAVHENRVVQAAIDVLGTRGYERVGNDPNLVRRVR